MTWARAAIFTAATSARSRCCKVAGRLPPPRLCRRSASRLRAGGQPADRARDDPAAGPELDAAKRALAADRAVPGTRGWRALYHGSSASVLKTVPKHVRAIWVKDYVAAQLPPPTAATGTREHQQQVLNRAAVKSIAAGVAGAALTNPLDVIRNEMFKYEVRAHA